MAIARTDSYAGRAEILGSLITRNRVVAVLRIAVPLIGLGAFALLVGQIYLSNMMRQYGVSGIRIDRGNVVVDAPRYSGTGADGSVYLLTAREAHTPLADSDQISMINPTLQYSRSTGGGYFGSAAAATMNTRTQIAIVPGLTSISGDDGMEGTLDSVEADMASERVTASGPVDITLANGTTITGSSMVHDGKAGTWTFTDATVIMQGLPGPEEP